MCPKELIRAQILANKTGSGFRKLGTFDPSLESYQSHYKQNQKAIDEHQQTISQQEQVGANGRWLMCGNSTKTIILNPHPERPKRIIGGVPIAQSLYYLLQNYCLIMPIKSPLNY
ncbi:hypothetical protein BI308_25745 [Roseofilum reptotaenium AO1-A]|uniref:Uncharacterized protein n=1 Tax=Roseofilum reptotaenium AO1-A TaxID=1925591 RepID=A0A1L9QCC8_9CYAN|nr:hypothetical protein BI308_25745 [Roseofilum reptotaenium AO1-A]